jgi:hypothetical protein
VLCLLHRLSITSILPSGAVQETPLLQPCTGIWPLTEGLLLVVREPRHAGDAEWLWH